MEDHGLSVRAEVRPEVDPVGDLEPELGDLGAVTIGEVGHVQVAEVGASVQAVDEFRPVSRPRQRRCIEPAGNRNHGHGAVGAHNLEPVVSAAGYNRALKRHLGAIRCVGVTEPQRGVRHERFGQRRRLTRGQVEEVRRLGHVRVVPAV